VWSGVGSSGDGVHGDVGAFALFEGVLHVGGSFITTVDGPASSIARWNGIEWEGLPGQLGEGTDGLVFVLLPFNESGGEVLLVGGLFDLAGGIPASNIARWDGSGWSGLAGGGLSTPPFTTSRVHDLASIDDGCGPKLWVAGEFTVAGGTAARNVARWDGTGWSAVFGPERDGTDDRVFAIGDSPFGSGREVLLGGLFREAGGLPSLGLARYRCAEIFSAGFEGGDVLEWSASVP
jgi:hypothetical protein